MKEFANTCNITVVQMTPVMFNKEKLLEKVIANIKETASNNAELIYSQSLSLYIGVT